MNMDVRITTWIIFPLLLIILCYCLSVPQWILAKKNNINISLLHLLMMKMRKTPSFQIVRTMIKAHKAGIKGFTAQDLEVHYLSGGNINNVVDALIIASRENIDLNFKVAASLDLAGLNILLAAQKAPNERFNL